MFKKALSVFAAGVIAASAVTASLGCMTVEAGAVTRKITYTAYSKNGWMPPVVIYGNFDIYGEPSSIGHENELVIEYDEGDSKAGGMPIVEDIKPTDVVTFSAITESGEEKILDIILGARSDGPNLTSYGIENRRLGVFRSGISVQEMIDSYNKDISEVRMLKEFKDVKDITFDDVYGIYAYEVVGDEACTWTITIEPGDGKSTSESDNSDKIDDSNNDKHDEITTSKKVTYNGHAESIKNLPGFFIYDNMTGKKLISSDSKGETDINADWAGGDVYFTEVIKPYDTVTYSITLPSGEEKNLNVALRLIGSSAITSDVVPSGITVQEMIEKYNEQLKKEKDLGWFKDAQYIEYKDIHSIYVSGNGQQDYDNFKWKFTIEPGDPNSIESSKKISDLQFSSIKNKTYTGKAITPAVTVKDGDKKLVKGTDYTVSYKNNTKIGTATVTINGKGKYNGTKTVEFKIVPKKVTLKGSVSDNEAALSWKKVKGATGYEVYRSVNGGAYKKLTDVKTTKYTAKLSAGTSYKYKVRAYAVVNGKRVYGSWSKVIKA